MFKYLFKPDLKLIETVTYHDAYGYNNKEIKLSTTNYSLPTYIDIWIEGCNVVTLIFTGGVQRMQSVETSHEQILCYQTRTLAIGIRSFYKHWKQHNGNDNDRLFQFLSLLLEIETGNTEKKT